jgi:hypothetical protein
LRIGLFPASQHARASAFQHRNPHRIQRNIRYTIARGNSSKNPRKDPHTDCDFHLFNDEIHRVVARQKSLDPFVLYQARIYAGCV